MKKSILFIICSLQIILIQAQNKSACDSVYLKTATIIKSDDPCLLAAANYVLEHPLTDNSSIHGKYMGFILNWMDKTPEFTFNLQDNVLTLCKDDNLLLFNIYLASLAKAAIETKKDYIPAALRLFVTYIEKPENKVKQTSKVRKMIASVKENKFEKYQ